MRKRRRTILVVDDEHDVLEMIELGLGLDGYRVLSAETGEQAIEAVARHQVDLVISDLRMPGMGGIETIARLREIAPHVPVIVVTGYLAPGAIEECMELGQVKLLRKPFRFKKLTHAIRAALDQAAPTHSS